jgi:hypothetical protein
MAVSADGKTVGATYLLPLIQMFDFPIKDLEFKRNGAQPDAGVE